MENQLPSQTEFFEQAFNNLRYQGGTIYEVEFIDCTFTKCTFAETAITGCAFNNCTFSECDLKLVELKGTSFTAAKFEGCNLIGINWALAAWDKAGFLRTIDFINCTLNYSAFVGLTLKEIIIRDCSAKEVDFAEVDLTKTDCRRTDFSKARFLHTNLTEADFSGASNYSIDVKLNTLKQTKFSLPEAVSLLQSLDIILDEETR